MPPGSTLSQEILDEIVGHLHDDAKTLKILDTVSSKFLPICRDFLFYSLRLDVNNCSRTADFLRDSPILGHSIKSVELDVAGFTGADEGDVVSILERVIAPIELALGDPLHPYTVPWGDLPTWLQQAIFRIISRSTIHSIIMTKLTIIPLSLFTGILWWSKW